MNSPGILRLIVIGFAFALSACGGGGDDDDSGAAGSQPAPPGIGAAGGTVAGPNGSKVEIPSGALAVVTQIAVDLESAAAPPLPAGLTPIGQMFAFTPHGTTFAVPVTVTMPFDPAAVPAGAAVALFKTNAQSQWVKVANAAFGANSVSGQVTSFSDFQVVQEDADLLTNTINRKWRFSELINVGFGQDGTQSLLEGPQLEDFGGDLLDVHEFAPANFDSGFAFFDGTRLEQNDIANGIVASAGDIRTFQVATEAPLANANIPGEAVGSETELIQEQTFLKQKEDATLTFTMPLARIENHDENAIIGRTCSGFSKCEFILGRLKFDLRASDFERESTEFFHIAGIATLSGFAQNWTRNVHTTIGSHVPFWNDTDFQLVRNNGPDNKLDSQAVLTLLEPLSFNVDLSSIDVGETFVVRLTATARAHNRLGGPPSELPTSAGAYMNFEDPSGGGGSLFITDGLQQVDTPVDVPDPPPLVLPPLPCDQNVGAGVLQFSAATYTTPETDTTPTVTITRTGGSSGRVSATLTTIGGTATGEADFEPVNATVIFADGDDEPRVVEIPIVEDEDAEGNETVELELSQPGGCVQLGPQNTAILTIVDDDVLPPPSGLDPTFGDGGKAGFKDSKGRPFGGDRSGMVVQPDGKIVMVGGTFAGFIMARFNADGSVDKPFGTGPEGEVTTQIVGADPNAQSESTAVALQRDGKIVVAGSATLPGGSNEQAIAIVRYNSNGTVDTSFNGNGFVFGPEFIHGRAFAVAIDSKDRIVVAGDTLKDANGDFSDFIVARYKPDGTLDTTFGQRGFNVTDIDHVTNEAHGLKVLAGDALLVSGFAPITVSDVNGVTTQSPALGAVVRYLENGFPDPTFGVANGRVALPGDNVGRGLAVQSDGRIVLAGSVDIGTFPQTTSRFALMRLLADGRIDDSFGDNGRVQTSLTDRGDKAIAVALQADGKIVAAGAANTQGNSNFGVARYLGNGDLDPSFDQDGKLTFDFFNSVDFAENIVIQSNGTIVLGGLARDNIDGYGVARVLP